MRFNIVALTTEPFDMERLGVVFVMPFDWADLPASGARVGFDDLPAKDCLSEDGSRSSFL